MRRISHLFGGCFLLAAVAACGGGSDGVGLEYGEGGAECLANNTFCMTASTFTQTSRTVGVNTAVIWINDSGVTHDVAFDTPAAALAVGIWSGNFQAPDKTSHHRQFASAGSYPFHCTIHGTATSGMRGTVVVQ